jgi:hypothetical protein
MKYKVIALFLALAVASWAQTATQTEPAAPQSAPTAQCPCCEKMASADAKEGHACMHHNMKSSDGKEMSSCAAMSCCGGKDAKSCMKGEKDASANSCCAAKAGEKMSGGCCGDKCSKDGKRCCSEKSEKTAANCCAGRMKS